MPDLILASASQIRHRLLADAGLSVEISPARVDENAVKTSMLAEDAAPRDIADALAQLKAARISPRHPGQLVLGCDQTLDLAGRLFDKPADLAEAREQLVALRGQQHRLHAAAVIYLDAQPVWRFVGNARLTMRDFSDAFLDSYLSTHGNDLLTTVGCYKVEAGGAQLFSRIEGDYFSILGLPLLEVFGFLRTRGIILE